MHVAEKFAGITGNNEKLVAVLNMVESVAPTETLVLIMGESGTGKERIAECIHELSPRAKHPLVKVNCAAIPVDLVESTLFGYERGAFTGAAEKRIGKFEQAQNGTLFLDEIGTLCLEAQAKLLRVLQENEIERVGGHTTIRLNVRIVTATNSDLEAEVVKGNFRADLYYRLHIFPITLPPLRERKEDIPLLIQHFMQIYCAKLKRNPIVVTQFTMALLLQYNWPGNIRELQHVIEKAVVLNEQPAITEKYQQQPGETTAVHLFKSIEEVERDHITLVLTCCNGKISGELGAARALRIAPTTLQSKIKRLGIIRNTSSC